jgi:hypothetical protein
VLDAWVTADGRILAALFTDEARGLRPNGPTFCPGVGRYGGVVGNRVRLWELASGNEVLDLKVSADAAALSQDGRLFAASNVLWDTVTGKQVHAWKSPGSMSHAAFIDDDKTLMVQALPHILFYDVAPHRKALRQAPAPDREALARLWADLASDDAARARRAVWSLADSPKQNLPLLADKLKPVPEVGDKELARLIRELDADKYTVRRQAHSELEKLRELAEPALRRALDNDPSAEQRSALKELLSALDRPITDKEKLRRLRAVEALEHSGTPEAQAVLKEMAKGAPAALETRGAKEALERLARRAPAKP